MNRVLPLFQDANATEAFRITRPHSSRPLTQAATTQHVDIKDQDDQDVAADIVYERRNAVLHIKISGPLDLRCASRLLAIARAADDSVVACRLGLSGVTQVFDSGLATLMLLTKILASHGIGRISIDSLGESQIKPTRRISNDYFVAFKISRLQKLIFVYEYAAGNDESLCNLRWLYSNFRYCYRNRNSIYTNCRENRTHPDIRRRRTRN